MINVDKVRGRLEELQLTQKDVANAVPTPSQKLHRVRSMDRDEAEKLAVLLEIDDARFGEYFFMH